MQQFPSISTFSGKVWYDTFNIGKIKGVPTWKKNSMTRSPGKR